MAYIGSKPANKPVVASDLDPAVITGQTALATSPADTDEFLISDAGVLKRLDASLIGGGKILQVVQGTSTTAFTQSSPDNSTRYFPSSNKITASITPSATSSKIIVQFQTTIKMESSSSDMGSAMCVKESISGGSTTIIESSGDAYGSGLYFASTVSSNVRSRLFESILRTPNTTSAITYEVGLMSYELTSIELNNNSSTGIITLMEVAG